ncbi:MAG TPA: GDSL-type esterase/lipase family protein [Thermomicrobiales bacterium]|jgi:lysophospholipase L1-like esterase
MATAGTTTLLDPLADALTGSLAAINPRPAPLAYLALGDSYAAGVGATDPLTSGYVPRFLAMINEHGGTPIGVKNLAVSGATSADFLGDWSTKGVEGSSPLAGAVKALNAGGISVVTINIGGNDILRLLKPGQPCAGSAIEGEPCLAAMREAMKTMAAPNLPIILGAIVEAAQPGTQILIVNYPNAFSTGQGTVTETRAGLAITELNALIATTVGNLQAPASGSGVTLTTIDIAPLFAGQGGKLTHVLDSTPDIHPTDAGHMVIAEALLKAYKR